MKNMNVYKTSCLALFLASSLTLSGCTKDDTNNISISGSSTVEVIGNNNNMNINDDSQDANVRINNDKSYDKNNTLIVNGVTITEENDKLNIQVEGENISINADSYILDNIEIEIKNNETDDGSLVFVRNIYNYIVEDGNVEFGIILDIPEDKKARKTIIYSYTYKIVDEDKAIYSIYEVDANGNLELLLTQIIDKSKGLRLNP